MITLSNLELASGWLAAANLGNTVPGQGATANYGITSEGVAYIASPAPYGNGYNYREIAVDDAVNAATKFHYEFGFSMRSTERIQALEFEFQRMIKGIIFNWALQLDFLGSKQFRHFDYAKKLWLPTGVPCAPLTSGVVHQVALEGVLLSDKDSGKTQNLIPGFSFDGVPYVTGFLFDGFVSAVVEDHFTHAIQLDTNGQNPPPPFEVALRNMTLSYA
jgi:hypothetical protein